MDAARENASLAWWAGRWFVRPWMPRWQWAHLKRILRSPYLWQDNVLTPWNRLIGCRLSGHQHKPVDWGNGETKMFCFRCYKEIKQ